MKHLLRIVYLFGVVVCIVIVLVGLKTKPAAAVVVEDHAYDQEYDGFQKWVLDYGVATKADIDPGYKKAENAFESALAKGDKASVASLLSDNFQWVEWDGTVQTKADILKDLDGFLKVNDENDSMDNRTTDFRGDIERVLGMHHNMRFAHIWAKGPAGWQAFIYLDMPIPKSRKDDVDPTNPPRNTEAPCPNPCGGVSTAFTPADEKQTEALKDWVEMKNAEWHPNPELWSSHADMYHETISPGGDLPMLQHVAQLSNARQLYGPHGSSPGQPVWKMFMYTFNNVVVQVDLEDPVQDKPTTWKVRLFVNRGDKPSGPGSDWRICLSAQTRITKNMSPEQVQNFIKGIARPS